MVRRVTVSGKKEKKTFKSETQTGAVAHEEKRKPLLVFMLTPKLLSLGPHSKKLHQGAECL